MAFPLDNSLHSFAPFQPDPSDNSTLDPLLPVYHPPTAESAAESFHSSSILTTTHNNEHQHYTSPSSAPSIINDNSPSTPHTPSSSSANSHFRLDLHSTAFSATLKPTQPRYTHPAAAEVHSLTSGFGIFPLFLAQRSPVLKACTFTQSSTFFQFLTCFLQLLNLPLDAPSFLADLFTSTALYQPASVWTLATHPAIPRSPQENFIWLVYEHHEQAVAALSSLSTTLGSAIVPALEDDLKPLDNLRSFDIFNSHSSTAPLATLRHRATAPSSMHQISLAQAQQPLPSIPFRPFSHITATPTPPRQNPRSRMHTGSPVASDSASSNDHRVELQDDMFGSKTKTPTVHPVRPRIQPLPPHMVPAVVDDMADLSRIGVLRATASMGDLHSRGQLPSPPDAMSYSSSIVASPNYAQSASGGTCTPNNSSTNNSHGFTLSTNPPAPRATAFRPGDWMCTAPGCGAHNFGRNSVCIGCGWARAHQLGASSAAATFGGESPGAVNNANMNFGPRGGMAIGFGMAYPSAPAVGGGGARPGVGNGIPRFAAVSGSASTPTADVNGLESAIGNLSLHPSAVQALGGPGGLNALQAAILAHQQHQQARGVVDRPKAPPATIHGNNNNNNSNNGRDAAVVAALNALQGLPGVGTASTSNGVPLLIPTTIAGSGNLPMVSSTLPGQTQGFSTMQPQLTQLQPQQQQQQQRQQQQQQQQNPVLQTLTHHLTATAAPPLLSLLTPSGRQIAQGGSVRNVSGDDTNPIFMYWPDNEPLPEPGQCRPPGLLTSIGGNGSGPLPPILNTGNKGPIETQPGDWTCRKCEYLNWRRRRVCVLCFPEAEGNSEGTKNPNSDVQERVTLLASLLAHQMQAQMTQQQQQQQQQHVLPQAQQPQPQSSLPTLGQRSLMRANSLPIGGGDGTSGFTSRGMCLGTSTGQPQRIHHSLSQAFTNFTPTPDETPTYHGLSSQNSAGLSVTIPSRFSFSNAGSSRSGSGYRDALNKDAPPFTPLSARAGSFGLGSSMSFQGFDSAPGSGKPSPPSLSALRSSFAIPIQAPPVSSTSRSGTNFSVEDKTPSPLPLLPSFMHEMVGGDSSTQPSPSTGTDGWPSRRLTPSTEGSEDSHSYRSRSSIASSFGGAAVEYPQVHQRLSSVSQHRPIVRQPSAPSGWTHDVGFFRDPTTTATK